MSKHGILLWGILLSVGTGAKLHAIDSDAGTSGASFMKIGAGNARALALGRAYVGLAEGADALTWNPAGLARADQKEAVFAHTDWVQDYKGQYLAYVHPLGRSVLGGNFAYFTLDGFDVRDENGIPQVGTKVLVRHSYATFSMARSFWTEKLFLGASLKEVHEDNSGSRRNTLAWDFGGILQLRRRLHIAAALQNSSGKKENLASTFRLGGAYQASNFLQLGLEIAKDSDNRSRTGIGAEFILPEDMLQLGQITFRTGYYAGDQLGQSLNSVLKSAKLDRTSGISFGFGLFSRAAFGYGVGLDYAFVPMGALGLTHHFTIKFKF